MPAVTTAVLELGILSIALAVDAAAVSAALGASGTGPSRMAAAALAFGTAQAGMSAFGALGGGWLLELVGDWDRWIVCGLLVAVGTRMAFDTPDDQPPSASAGAIVVLALATSIDALAAGVALPLSPISWVASVGAIGVVTLGLSILAGWAGQRAGALLGPHAMRLAGGVLVVLGLRALW